MDVGAARGSSIVGAGVDSAARGASAGRGDFSEAGAGEAAGGVSCAGRAGPMLVAYARKGACTVRCCCRSD